MLRWEYLTQLNPVPVALKTGPWTLKLEPNYRYHEIHVQGRSGDAQDMDAGFDSIRLMIDDKPQRDRTFQITDDLNSRFGAPYAVKRNVNGGNFRLRYIFSQFFRKEYLSAEKFCLDIDDGIDAQIQFRTKAAVTAPELAFSVLREPLNEVGDVKNGAGLNFAKENGDFVLGKHSFVANGTRFGRLPRLVKEFTTPVNVAAGSIVLRDEISKDNLTQMLTFGDPRLNGAEPNTYIDKVTITADGVGTIWEKTRQEADDLLEDGEMMPHPKYYIIDPDFTDRPDLPWIFSQYRNLKFKIDFKGAPTASSQIEIHHDRWGRAD